MKQRSLFYSLTLCICIFLLIAVGGCQWLNQENRFSLLGNGNPKTPEAAMFVPKQAPVMLSLLVKPERLEQRRYRQELNQLKTSLFASTGLDYRRDIQPWLSNEITLAITGTDIDLNPENGKQPGYLIALATDAPKQSREFVESLFSQKAIAGTEVGVEQYKGVKLLYEKAQPGLHDGNKLSAAVVGNRFVLFANHPKVLRNAINNVQAPALGLSSSSQYQQALASIPARGIGLTFLNLDSVAEWFGNQPEVQTYHSQIITWELTSQGLAAKTALQPTAAEQILPPAPNLSQPVKALSYIPSRAGLAIAGTELNNLENTNLNLFWQQFSSGVAKSGYDIISRLVNQPLTALETSAGINLPKDIFSWVQGEYALGMLPPTKGTKPDWIFVAERKDAATAGISHLDELAQAQGLSISSLNLGNQKISAWTQLTTANSSLQQPDTTAVTLQAKVAGVHATVGNFEVFTSSVEAMNAALKAPQKQSLLDNPTFKASIEPIPKPNQGYLYLDWLASRETLERQLPILKFVEVLGNPLFRPLRSLTISSYGREPNVLQGGAFLKFGGEG